MSIKHKMLFENYVPKFEEYRQMLRESEGVPSDVDIRNPNFKFEVKRVKGEIEGIVASLKPDAPEELKALMEKTKLTADSLVKLYEDEKRTKQIINTHEAHIRSSFDIIFKKEDEILTRQLESISSVIQIGKKSIAMPKENKDYEGILNAITELFNNNMEIITRINAIIEDPKFIKVTKGSDRAGSLNPTANRMAKTEPLEESMSLLGDRLYSWVMSKINNILRIFRKTESILVKLNSTIDKALEEGNDIPYEYRPERLADEMMSTRY